MGKENGGGVRKKSLIRRILSWLGIIIVLLVLLVAVAIAALNPIVRSTVTKVGTMATGTGVELSSVDISLLRGRVELLGFAVLNPSGCRERDAIDFRRFVADVELTSLSSDKIVIEEVIMDGLDLDLEITPGGSNLTDIKNNIDAFTRKLAGGGEKTVSPEPASAEPASQAEPAPDGKPDKKMVIRVLKIINSSIRLSSTTLDMTMTIPLPDVEMTDVGDGRSINEMVQVLYDSLYDAVIAAVKSATVNLTGAFKDVGSKLDGAARNFGRMAGSTADQLNSAARGAGDAAGKAVNDIGSAAKGMGNAAGKAAGDVGNAVKSVGDEFKKLF